MVADRWFIRLGLDATTGKKLVGWRVVCHLGFIPKSFYPPRVYEGILQLHACNAMIDQLGRGWQ